MKLRYCPDESFKCFPYTINGIALIAQLEKTAMLLPPTIPEPNAREPVISNPSGSMWGWREPLNQRLPHNKHK